MIGDLGESYCMIPGEHLKLLNKFMGVAINNSMIMVKCEEGDQTENFLSLIYKEHHHTDFQLTTTKV